jgi:glycine cleavage system regulatory protein
MAQVILSVIGSDRPGLTQAVADAVLAAGGNWLESHLSQLAGLYVGAVLVELDAGQLDALRAGVSAIDARGLDVRLTPVLAPAKPAAGEALTLNVVGADRLGIVRQVSAALAALNVNIETFETRIVPEANTGAPLFDAVAHLRLPAGLKPAAVQAALEAISAEIMVDITLASPR